MKNLSKYNLENKIFLYPTDTVYGIGCDATSFELVDKIYSIKSRSKSKSLIVLVSSIEMLLRYVSVEPKVLNFIENYNKSLTFIYKNVKGLAKNITNNNTTAIRIIKENILCKDIINNIDKPIVSTSANISGEITPIKFEDVSEKIIESVDLYFKEDYNIKKNSNIFPSDIVKIENGEIIFIRKQDVFK